MGKSHHFPQPSPGPLDPPWYPWMPLGPSDAKAVGHAPARSCCTAKSQAKRPLESPEILGIRNHDDGHWWLFHEIWDQEWLVDDWWIHDYIILDEMFGCWNSQKKLLDDCFMLWMIRVALKSRQCLTGATGNVPSSSILEPIRSPVSSTFTGPVKWRACATSTWATSWKPWLFWSQNVKPYGFPYIKT